jgi:anti-sigma-K factor RskA
MSETEHDHWRDELAAYALAALEPGEAADLERHLAGCEECRTELEWLRPAVQLLPESVARVEPPSELRSRLIEQVRSEATAGSRPSRRGLLARLGLGGEGGLRGQRAAIGLTAVALIVAGLVGYTVSGGDSGGGGTTTVAAGHSPGVVARVVRDGETGTLRLANLRQLPPDKVLQAWVRRGGQVVSAKALFVPNSDGTATATIDDMQGVNTVMVTAEPRGGSVQPTSAPIVSVSIPQ